jgi:hypothetical protein
MVRRAGGGRASENPGIRDKNNLDEFILQAEEYRTSEDVADSVFKILNLLGQTHPFWVLRVAEIRTWIESGEYDRIMAGDYQRRGDPDPGYTSDLREAARAYAEGAKGVFDEIGDAARKMGESILGGFRR